MAPAAGNIEFLTGLIKFPRRDSVYSTFPRIRNPVNRKQLEICLSSSQKNRNSLTWVHGGLASVSSTLRLRDSVAGPRLDVRCRSDLAEPRLDVRSRLMVTCVDHSVKT